MSTTALASIRLEIDITPRWFVVGPFFFADVADLARAIGESESKLLPLLQDIQVGTTGVRAVLAVPAEVSTTVFEVERQQLVAAIDGLDAAVPRRARVTAARRAQALQGAPAAPPATDITPEPPEAAATHAAAA